VKSEERKEKGARSGKGELDDRQLKLIDEEKMEKERKESEMVSEGRMIT
jgi:hypothetical protein